MSPFFCFIPEEWLWLRRMERAETGQAPNPRFLPTSPNRSAAPKALNQQVCPHLNVHLKFAVIDSESLLFKITACFFFNIPGSMVSSQRDNPFNWLL